MLHAADTLLVTFISIKKYILFRKINSVKKILGQHFKIY